MTSETRVQTGTDGTKIVGGEEQRGNGGARRTRHASLIITQRGPAQTTSKQSWTAFNLASQRCACLQEFKQDQRLRARPCPAGNEELSLNTERAINVETNESMKKMRGRESMVRSW